MKPRYITFGFVVLFVIALALFPFFNPCTTENAVACTWHAAERGDGTGWTFTDYWGAVTLYWFQT